MFQTICVKLYWMSARTIFRMASCLEFDEWNCKNSSDVFHVIKRDAQFLGKKYEKLCCGLKSSSQLFPKQTFRVCYFLRSFESFCCNAWRKLNISVFNHSAVSYTKSCDNKSSLTGTSLLRSGKKFGLKTQKTSKLAIFTYLTKCFFLYFKKSQNFQAFKKFVFPAI